MTAICPHCHLPHPPIELADTRGSGETIFNILVDFLQDNAGPGSIEAARRVIVPAIDAAVRRATEGAIAHVEACRATQSKYVAALMMRTGTISTCGAGKPRGVGCGATIHWVRQLNEKLVPYTPAGLIHFVDCPVRDQFQEKIGKEKAAASARPDVPEPAATDGTR